MTTYYADYANGNDADDGSSGSPWKTIAGSIGQMSEGDTLYLRGDSSDYTTFFREKTITINVASVTIHNDTGHTPVLAGSVAYTSWSKTAGQTNVYEATHTGANWGGCYNGATYLESVADVATCDSTTNSYYFDNANNKLYVNIGGDAPTCIEAYLNHNYNLTISANNVSITGLIQWYCNNHCSIEGSGCTLTNCTFARTGYFTSNCLKCNQANLTLDTVTIVGVPRVEQQGNILELLTGCSGTTLTNCDFQDGDNGIQVDAGDDTLIEYCTIHRQGEFGINFGKAGSGGTAGGTVQYCTFYDIRHGSIRGQSLHEGTVTIKYCLHYHTTDDHPQVDSLNGSLGFVHVHGHGTWNVYHCTAAYGTRAGAGYGYGFCIWPTEDNMTFTAKNNILYELGETAIHHNEEHTVTLDLDYNLLNSNDPDWQGIAEEDQGANNVTTDPQFADAANDDFTLAAASPAIDAGTTIADITEGTEGSAPDIGRYEWPYPDSACPPLLRRMRH